MCLVCYGWLLFRATSLDQILTFSSTLFFDIGNLTTTVERPAFAGLLGLGVLAFYEATAYRVGGSESALRLSPMLMGALCATFTFVLILGLSNEPAQFIYFQF